MLQMLKLLSKESLQVTFKVQFYNEFDLEIHNLLGKNQSGNDDTPGKDLKGGNTIQLGQSGGNQPKKGGCC